MHKLIRVTTLPISMEKLLENQLEFMKSHFDITAISRSESEGTYLEEYGKEVGMKTLPIEFTRAITPIQDVKSILKLYKYLKKEKPEIIHSHTPKAGMVSMIAAKLAGVPIRLHTVAGLPLEEAKGMKKVLLKSIEKITYAAATKVLPNSKGLKKTLLEFNLCQEKKINIIGKGSSNGINTTYFNPEKIAEKDINNLKKELGFKGDETILIYIGRLVKDKGVNELITTFDAISRTHKNCRLLLLGYYEQDRDPLNEETVRIIKENPTIIERGFIKDIRPYLLLSSFLVFPSYREGFPNVVLQAAAMQLPAIVTDINGCNEIIQNNNNGLIIPKKNKEALKDAILYLIENKSVLENMKLSTRNFIQENFAREIIWNELLNMYTSEIKRNHEK
jgi:glycosyltransferase involved in cell wall biosynthesis